MRADGAQSSSSLQAASPSSLIACFLRAHPDNHHTSFSGGRGFFSRPLASRLVGPIVRFPGHPPLDRPAVGGATPTPLGGVPSGGVCGSAHLLTSGHVPNGDGAESETGRVRRPLLADWPKRDAMLMFNSTHARARWQARKECCEQSVVVVVSDVKM